MSKEKVILQNLWRKALRQDREVEIPCPAESDARKLRFALYAAVKDVRKGKAEDRELLEATETCGISHKEGAPNVLILGPKTKTTLMQAALAALGDMPETLEGERELREAGERMRRLQEAIDSEKPRQSGLDKHFGGARRDGQ